MIAFFRKLSNRLDRADKFEDDRHSFYEERLSHLADRVKELQDLHTRERSILADRLDIHDARLQALDYWTRDVGRLAGVGAAATDLETVIESDDDDVENWDEELSIGGMMMWPAPTVEEDASEA